MTVLRAGWELAASVSLGNITAPFVGAAICSSGSCCWPPMWRRWRSACSG